jgi:hypothetical protein
MVVFSAVVYLGSAAHFALVQHATCLEHGESIHAGDGKVSTPPQQLEVAFTDVRVTRASPEATAAHGAEAHCTHTFFRREGLVSPAVSLLAPDAEPEFGPVRGREQLHPEPVARLRLAPKSSPPLS